MHDLYKLTFEYHKLNIIIILYILYYLWINYDLYFVYLSNKDPFLLTRKQMEKLEFYQGPFVSELYLNLIPSVCTSTDFGLYLFTNGAATNRT